MKGRSSDRIFCSILMQISAAAKYHEVVLVVKNLPANTGDVRDTGSIPGWEDPLEKEMATHASILAWRISWTEEPGGLQSRGSQRVGYD